MNKRYLSLASIMTLCLLLLLMSGCGSSSNKEGETSAVAVGDRLCVQCHSAVTESLTGQTLMAQYENSSPHRDSAHANDGNGCEACHGNASQHQGIGPIAFPDPYASSGARCADCHKGNYAGNFSTKFATSNHATVMIEESANCVRCHTHEGALLANIAGLTGDYAVITNKAYQTLPIPAKGYSQFKCQTCHEHGAGLRAVMARYNNPFKPTEAANGTIMAWDPNNNREQDQYDLCTSCHTLTTNTYGTGVIASNGREVSSSLLMSAGTPAHEATGKPTTVKAGYHDTSWYRQISSTHYDNPATGLNATNAPLATGNVIEGYVIRNNKETPCFDCHAHEANTGTRYGQTTTPTIYTDWAQSGHAGRLLRAKYAAAVGKSGAAAVDSVMISGASSTETSTDYPSVDASGAAITITRKTSAGDAWAHYQWEKTLNAAGGSDRGACQQCHTATGVANFLTNPAAYDYKTNDFTHLSGYRAASTGVATTPSPQQEVLYCWGCHSNAGTGALRKPGALSFTYTNNAKVTYPDISGSNICMACHTGRETGDSIKNDTDADGVRSFLNSHYLAAGGQLFGTTGYEYAGLNYANPSYFAHDKIGTTAEPGTGSNGPCAGCHMSTPNSHQFTNVTKDAGGHITAITSTVCAECHSGNYALTPEGLTEEEEEYKTALDAALAVTAGKGLFFIPAHPYWYKDPAGGSANAFTNWAGMYGLAKWKDVMGAAFNINLLIHDPGGYAHNRYYVKRLLWDSIDFITDGTLGNIDMAATIDGLATLTAAQKEAAKKYLGTARP
ncbi:MAG: C-type polyheme cytochrome OmcB [Syntrophales bacterium]